MQNPTQEGLNKVMVPCILACPAMADKCTGVMKLARGGLAFSVGCRS